jgi:tetratricopeptide (TPR) repeat protein
MPARQEGQARRSPISFGPALVISDESAMITEPVVAASRHGDGPVAPAVRVSLGPAGAGRRRAFPRRTLMLLVTGLIGGGIALFGWRHWRDTRPVADLRMIETWIGDLKYDLAETELRKHLSRNPRDGAARIMLARVLAASGDLAGCTRELHQVPTWWPRKAEALYREGQAYLLIDRARDAEAAFLAVINPELLHPADPAVFHDASQKLLSIYATEDRWDNAHAILWKVYDRATPAYRPIVLAMRIQSELERIAPTESVKLLNRYVAADSDDWEARRALANAELALGQHSEALRDIRDCLDARPDDPRVWRDYLKMLQSLGEVDDYSAVLARLPAIAETEPDLWIFRGQARERAGDWKSAAPHYRRALELNPNLMSAHYRLATIEGRLGHSAQAAAHRKRWQELHEARSELRQAFGEYFDAQKRLANDSPELLTSIERLASICQTLGWSRAAESWRRLAVP